MSLLERTQELLTKHLNAGMTLREISDLAGEELQFEWLRKFKRGKIPDPSVNRIQLLHDTLKTIRKNNA